MRLRGNTTFAFFLLAPTHEYLVRDRICFVCGLCDKSEVQKRAVTHKHLMCGSVCLERGSFTDRCGTRSAVSVAYLRQNAEPGPHAQKSSERMRLAMSESRIPGCRRPLCSNLSSFP